MRNFFVVPIVACTAVDFPFIGDSFIIETPALRGTALRRSSDSWVEVTRVLPFELESYCDPILAESIYVEKEAIKRKADTGPSRDLVDMCRYHLGDAAGLVAARMIGSNIRNGSMADQQARAIVKMSDSMRDFAACNRCHMHSGYDRILKAGKYVIAIRTTMKLLYAGRLHLDETEAAAPLVERLQETIEQLMQLAGKESLLSQQCIEMMLDMDSCLVTIAGLGLDRYLLSD